jgi:hypothetical protein
MVKEGIRKRYDIKAKRSDKIAIYWKGMGEKMKIEKTNGK